MIYQKIFEHWYMHRRSSWISALRKPHSWFLISRELFCPNSPSNSHIHFSPSGFLHFPRLTKFQLKYIPSMYMGHNNAKKKSLKPKWKQPTTPPPPPSLLMLLYLSLEAATILVQKGQWTVLLLSILSTAESTTDVKIDDH